MVCSGSHKKLLCKLILIALIHGLNAKNDCIFCYYLNLNRKQNLSGDLLLLGLAHGLFNVTSIWKTTWGCAGDTWSIPVRVVEMRGIKGCNEGSRHVRMQAAPQLSCALKHIMTAFTDRFNGQQALQDLNLLQKPRWIFFFDRDSLPMPTLALQSFLDKKNSASLVLFEDFQTGAINAATILARVDEYSQSFFNSVHTFHDTMGHKEHRFHSAFEVALLHWLKDELKESKRVKFKMNDTLRWVDSRFKAIQDLKTYDRYLATAKYALGPRRTFQHLLLLRRGHGFCMDLPMDLGMASHAQYSCFRAPEIHADADCLAKVSICQEWLSSCMSKAKDSTKVSHLPVEQIRHYRPQRMGLGMVNDVANCWPNCEANIPADVWKDLERGLHFNAKCPNRHCRLGCCCKDFDLISEQHAADSADEFMFGLVIGISVLIVALCCFLSWKQMKKNTEYDASSPGRSRMSSPSFVVTSPRSIELTRFK